LFIDASILPTSLTYTLSKKRLLLSDKILNEDYVDLGRIIAREILECPDKNSGFLFFLCLITKLFMMQGVHINGNE